VRLNGTVGWFLRGLLAPEEAFEDGGLPAGDVFVLGGMEFFDPLLVGQEALRFSGNFCEDKRLARHRLRFGGNGDPQN